MQFCEDLTALEVTFLQRKNERLRLASRRLEQNCVSWSKTPVAVLEQLACICAIRYGVGSRISLPVQSIYGKVFKLPNSHFLLFKMEIALKIVLRNDSHSGLGWNGMLLFHLEYLLMHLVPDHDAFGPIKNRWELFRGQLSYLQDSLAYLCRRKRFMGDLAMLVDSSKRNKG